MPLGNAIDLHAARWAVRLSAGSLGPEQQAALDEWLAADVRHPGALSRARAAWLDLDRLAALAGGPRRDGDLPAPKAEPSSPGRRWFLAASVAATALGGGGAAWWLWSSRGQIYVSDIGEVRRVTLADGSSMLLNTASRAVVRFTPTLRHVELTRGEGLFEVAKDPARPFIVRTRTVTVRAVGTVFAVRAFTDDIDITVTEGTVEVAEMSAPDTSTVQTVSADQQAVVTPTRGIKVHAVTEAQAERRLAWRQGMLIFDSEPLSQAVAEVNRHNVRKILIDDPALAERPVVGIFKASDEGGFARTVAAALNAECTESDDAIHLLARR